MIRSARADELPALREIEKAAGRAFAEIGMTLVAEDDPPPVAELAEFQRAGRAWVSTDDADRPIAYLIAAVVDGQAHLEQVSVHPDHAYRGVGRALIEHLVDWARAQGYRWLTLTTYVDVPWNGPYYRRLGFRLLAPDELEPELRAIRAAEAARGLDRWRRAGMRYEL